MILFTSDINKKGIVSGMVWTFGIMIFGAIYEHFSFGVYSGYMIYAFVPMLVETAFLMVMYEKKRFIGSTAKMFLRCASITASIGCAATGIVEIYGTENRMLKYYAIAAGILYLIAFGHIITSNTEERHLSDTAVGSDI